MKKIISVGISVFMIFAMLLSAVNVFAADGAVITPLTKCTVSLEYSKAIYDGKSKTPKVTVKNGSQVLASGKDYAVSYSSNKSCGTATVRVTGKGNYSGTVTKTFTIVPKRVTGMTSGRTTSSISLKWPKVAGAAVYKVYQSTSPNGTYKKVKTVTSPNVTISKLTAGKKYYFRVVACGKKDGSFAGQSSTSFYTATAPKRVTIKSVSKSGSSMTVKWNKVTCSGYQIQYSTYSNFSKNVKTVKISSGSTTSKTIKGLSTTSTYYVRVRAKVSYSHKSYNGSFSASKSTGYTHLYASYSSKYVNNKNRTTNLKIASKAIDGKIIRPGQTFSFNKTVGVRTAAKGYKKAPIFAGSGTVNDVGGGICQVASTMYNTALLANVKITERHQHNQRVTYVPLGRDAAIYWSGNQDFKWTNNTKYSIKIRMTVSNGVITCKFYTVSNVNPKKVKLSVSKSGKNFTLKRSVSGKVNYTAKSKY